MVAWSDPRQYAFAFALWTLALARELIGKEFGIGLSEVSVGRILRTLGLSPQRPLRVSEWLHKEYPALRARAKREGALIFFADDAGVCSDHRAGARFGLYMLSGGQCSGAFPLHGP